MNITIQEGCISCGLCVSACPRVFGFGPDELAHVVGAPVTAGQLEAVQRAAQGCPTGVIRLSDGAEPREERRPLA